MIKKYLQISILLLLIPLFNIEAQDCNRWPLVRCTGNTLNFTKNSGQSAHFVNIAPSPSMNTIDKYLTFEAWIYPDIESGRRNYIAGKWGPTPDKSDTWQLFFEGDGSIVFELNHPDFELENLDNTIIKTSPVDLNGEWHHIAAVFNGDSATGIIYIDGIEVARGTNDTYPINNLSPNQNDTQIGRANEMSNDNSYRTFRGQMDEIRIWNRALSETEIICEKDKYREQNEAGLITIFRCNENPGTVGVCDGSNNGNDGILLSGLTTTNQNSRQEYRPFVVEQFVRTDTVQCEVRKTYTITVTDTSLCGSRARIWIHPNYRQYFDYNGGNINLPPGEKVTFSFDFNSDMIGNIDPIIRLIRDNRCGFDLLPGNQRRWNITRQTELTYSADTLTMGNLKAHCVEEPYREKTIQVCNNTIKTGSNKVMTITDFLTNMPGVFDIVSPPTPISLQPGECTDITLRFTSGDTAAVYWDTLRVKSNDICVGAGIIPLHGSVEQIISITKFGTEGERLDSVDFGRICKDFPSDESIFYWENLSSQNIRVVDVEVPGQFQFIRFNPNNPEILEPNKSYQVKIIRFVPNIEGVFDDSVVIVVKAGGCTLRRPIYVKGKSIHPDIHFELDTVDFGNVFVGQENERFINITNFSQDTFRVSFSLSTGDVFYFPGGRFATLPPGEQKSVRVRFRPLTDSLYFDRLCFQETPQTGCYSSGCITLMGNGITDKYDFVPDVMPIENVIACQDSTQSLEIRNVSGTNLTLSNFVLNDPSGRFDVIYPVPDNNSLNGYNHSFSDGELLEFEFRYTPNDLTNDRADNAFLEFEDNDGDTWAVKLRGTSVVPRLFMEQNNAFGTIEVGERPTRTITLENISSVAVHLDSLTINSAFNILYPNQVVDRTLEPRDTIEITVEFVPTQAIDYFGTLTAHSSQPCVVTNETKFTGRGKIIPIEIISTLVTFGFVKNCECEEAAISLANNSKVNDAIIDSIWIDDAGITLGYPEYYDWDSDIGGKSLPFTIPPRTIDTLRVNYCPRSPSIRDSLNHSAMLHIDAHGISPDGNTEVWSLEEPYDRYLAGKQLLVYEPAPLVTQFPPTLVDNFAASRNKRIVIPDISVNPDRADIVIDSVTFEPEERVFFASDALGRNFPIRYSATEDTLLLQIDFKPRVYRDYEAKVKIHFSEPCYGIDTTMTVLGSGFATPFTMPFDFKQALSNIREYDVISCDTLELPIFASRKVPANIIDMDFRVRFDTTLFEYIGFESPYIGFNGNPEKDICTQYDASVNSVKTDSSTLEFSIKNFCDIDSVAPFMITKFVPKVDQTITTTFELDSFNFDSKDVILFRLLPDKSEIDVNILKSDFEILNTVDYDTVRILECKVDTIIVENTGDVDFLFNSINNLPDYVTVLSVTPPQGDTIRPTDLIEIVIEYCPLDSGIHTANILTDIFQPCYMDDSTNVSGYGFAPPFTLLSDVSENFIEVDTLYGLIREVVQVPVYISENVLATYNGTDYWMTNVDLGIEVKYDKKSLMYMSSENSLQSEFNPELIENGLLQLNYTALDTVKAGKVADVNFLVVIPREVNTDITSAVNYFNSNDLNFLTINSDTLNAVFNTGQSCDISRVVFPGEENLKVYQNSPNPWGNYTEIRFTLAEESTTEINVYDASGNLVYILLTREVLTPGEYIYTISKEHLPQGTYFYEVIANSTRKAKKMLRVD